jgi:hypothetical protein
MQRVGLAAFISGAGLYIVLPFHLHGGTPLHLRASIFAITMARRHREHAMAGNFPPIYRCEESLRIQGICTMYRPRPARARRGKSDRCVTRPGESFFGRAPAIGTCPGSHWAVRCCTTALRSPLVAVTVQGQDSLSVKDIAGADEAKEED